MGATLYDFSAAFGDGDPGVPPRRELRANPAGAARICNHRSYGVAMQGNVRFGVAVHILVMLALAGEPQNSARIAESVDTNPVVIRRLLGLLQRAGLVRGRTGPGGGFRLARPAQAITLDQVFRAVEDEGPAPSRHRANRKCPIARNVSTVLAAVGERAERAFLATLARQSLADAVGQVRKAAGAELA